MVDHITIFFPMLLLAIFMFSYMLYRFLQVITQFSQVLTTGITSIKENSILSVKALETAQRIQLLESQVNILSNANEDLRRERDYLKETIRDKSIGQSESE